jgi:hypothetical protein
MYDVQLLVCCRTHLPDEQHRLQLRLGALPGEQQGQTTLSYLHTNTGRSMPADIALSLKETYPPLHNREAGVHSLQTYWPVNGATHTSSTVNAAAT